MISLWLAHAKAEGATAFVIGMPRQLPTSIGEHDVPAYKRWLAGGRTAADVHDGAASASKGVATLESVAGWRTVPVWAEHGGQLFPVQGPPVDLLFVLQSRIEQRLVSLDAKYGASSRARFIEYDSDTAETRCFAEVELLTEEDNTLRISILRHVCVPALFRDRPI